MRNDDQIFAAELNGSLTKVSIPHYEQAARKHSDHGPLYGHLSLLSLRGHREPKSDEH